VIFERLSERDADRGDTRNERTLIGIGSSGELSRDCGQVVDYGRIQNSGFRIQNSGATLR
jgi:hypothetical protein